MILLYEPKSDDATLSWGSWSSGLPLANLKDQQLGRVARSASTANSSTRLRVALAAAEALKALAVARTTLTPAFRYRVRSYASDAFSGAVHDSGWQTPFGGVATDAWDDPERGVDVVHVFAGPVTARYWSIEFDDTNNPAGFVDFGRLFMARAWQPSTNYDYGSNGLRFQNNGFSAQTLGGGKSFWGRMAPRIFRFAIPSLAEAEAFGDGYRIMQVAGFDGEVFVIPDPEDGAQTMRKRAFLGTLTEMDAISQAMFGRASVGLQIEERL